MPIPGVYQKVAEGQQSQRKIGTVENPKKFKGQDFNSLREMCLNRRQLFEDDVFPASLYSIGQDQLSQDKLLSIKWKRPSEINKDPRFLVDGASIFDLMQGEIGDCWVLAVVGALTLHRRFLENVIPKDQEFTHKYAGIFHFRFWQYGEWVDVVVDDRLPLLHGKYLSVQPRSSNEFWPSLLEKAYAKLRGSYQNLHWGFISEALVDFTGGVQIDFDLSKPPPDLRDIVLAAARSGSLMGCTTPGNLHTGNMELQNGLVQGHAYTVTEGLQIEYNNRLEDIVRVWNPWGAGEWNGRWSDRSPQWDRVQPEMRKRLNVQSNDGEFWMSCPDFMQNFRQVNICNLTPTYLDFESPQRVWESTSYYNQWVRGSTAGGCNTAEDMWKNPQYVITVPETQRKGYNVTVALMQSLSNERKYNPHWLPIGFAFCKVWQTSTGTKNGSQTKFSRQQATEIINTNLERGREVTKSFVAPPGTYVILPFTENKGQESEFLLRIFMKTSQIAENQGPQTVQREDNQEQYPVNSTTQTENNYPPSTNCMSGRQKIGIPHPCRTSAHLDGLVRNPARVASHVDFTKGTVSHRSGGDTDRCIPPLLYRLVAPHLPVRPHILFCRSVHSSSAGPSAPLLLVRPLPPAHVAFIFRPRTIFRQVFKCAHIKALKLRHRRKAKRYIPTIPQLRKCTAAMLCQFCNDRYQSVKVTQRVVDDALYDNNALASLKKYKDESYESVFSRYANQSSEMYAEQLQKLLNDVVITDPTFNANRAAFSLDSCRGILMLMDLNANGKLSLQEFARLWKRLNMCKDTSAADIALEHLSIDVNQTGYIDGYGVNRSVQDLGLPVTDAVMNIMLLRYGNYSKKLTFADFVSCMIRLETVTKVFQNLTKDGGGIYLTAEERTRHTARYDSGSEENIVYFTREGVIHSSAIYAPRTVCNVSSSIGLPHLLRIGI
ncbi:PREDICTED: calpain-13-like [Nanorana parkeri]|uniref:calpain-13-like n=1 Tax=Nanorana parkeri TaxID=125878 RepID=UPI0008542EB2|nr:PREDICTED: calpain-13-like [Nanorana parkeri]